MLQRGQSYFLSEEAAGAGLGAAGAAGLLALSAEELVPAEELEFAASLLVFDSEDFGFALP
jgi:hypothetical protein